MAAYLQLEFDAVGQDDGPERERMRADGCHQNGRDLPPPPSIDASVHLSPLCFHMQFLSIIFFSGTCEERTAGWTMEPPAASE